VDESVGTSNEPEQRKTKAIFLITVGLFVLVGIIVTLVIILVTRDDGPGASDPRSLVQEFIKAVEEEDVDAYIECYDPNEIAVGATPTSLKLWLENRDIEFINEDIVVSYGENKLAAMVQVKKGEMIETIDDWQYIRDLDEYPLTLFAISKDGRYYMDENFIIQWHAPDEETRGMI
jgi:hypothetical protein